MPPRFWCAPLAVLLLAACSYTSQYVPPVDGRARVVWRQGNPVAMVPASSCRDRAFTLAAMPPQAPVGEAHSHVQHAVWVDLPIFVPFPHLHGPPPPPHFAGSGPVHRAVPANAQPPSGDGGSAGGSGGEELWVVMAVAGLIVMPAIAAGLAVTDPEDALVAAGSIDLANAYNDLARTPGSGCPAVSSTPPESTPVPASTASEVSP